MPAYLAAYCGQAFLEEAVCVSPEMGTESKSRSFVRLRVPEGEVCSPLHRVVNVTLQVAQGIARSLSPQQPLSHSVRILGTLCFDPHALAS